MTLKLESLATAVTFVLATAAAAQSQPMTTTQASTTQTQPTTAPAGPPTTTQTTTTQTQPTTPTAGPPTTTQSTTTQTQSTAPPADPATTTQTTTTQTQPTSDPASSAPAAAKEVRKATADDIKAKVSVYDQSGALVGKIDSVDADGAIINTGKARAEIPLSSFGKNDKGLVVTVTKAELDAQGKKAVKKETKPKS